ncbi:MAG: DUF3500 domain-containing protein [Dehalococcoidia bacterium]
MRANEHHGARTEAAERMAEAAGRWLETLSGDQLAKAALSFGDGERRSWFYTPTYQAGLPLAEMDQRQQGLAHRVAWTGLSRAAYVTASQIIGLENALERIEDGALGQLASGSGYVRWRDPSMYFLAIFGTPGSRTWGWRFGGHHISLNFTIHDGALVSPTPTFFGANPAETQTSGMGPLRPLAREEDLARELLHTLDEPQRVLALIATAAPEDIVQGNRPLVAEGAWPLTLAEITRGQFDPAYRERLKQRSDQLRQAYPEEERERVRYRSAPTGLPAGSLRQNQRGLFEALIRQYVDRLPDAVAAAEWDAIKGRGLDEIHFAWAGGADRHQPHYYRLHGPRFLIEYDHVQNDANHVHTVWRDPEGDFGGDPLAEHRAAMHT